MTADLALDLSEALVAVAVIVGSSELLAVRGAFGPGGMLAAGVAATAHARVATRHRMTQRMVRPTSVVGIHVTRVLGGSTMVILVAGGRRPGPWLLAALFVATLLMHYVMVFGLSAADQMVLVVLGGLVVAEVGAGRGHSALVLGGLGFVAAQAALCYSVAGMVKLRGSEWRSGSAVRDIVDTRAFGHPAASAVLSRTSGLARGLTYAVLLFEIGFPVVFVLPPVPLAAYLAAGVALHVGVGAIMGLNLFLWAFPATYPAVAYVACRLAL